MTTRRVARASTYVAAALGVVLGAPACGTTNDVAHARDESWRVAPTRLGAELEFFAPYVGLLSRSCNDKFELALLGRSPVVILTEPATYESAWELRTCKNSMHAILDCAGGDEAVGCSAHEWPLAREPDAILAHELEAVALKTPACPEDCKGSACSKDAFAIARTSSSTRSDADPWHALSSYRASRCGLVVNVNVDCEMKSPYRCAASASPAE